ncbi:MAG: GNAT family protein [Bacteroidia bacterium]
MKQFELPNKNNYSFKLITSNDFELFSLFRKNDDIMAAINKAVESDEQIYSKLKLYLPENKSKENLWWFIYKNNLLIGNFGLKIDYFHKRAEIGYCLFKEYWNQKHMSFVLPVLLQYSFNELNLHSLEARINPKNTPSKKLLLSYDFVKEGYFKQDYFYNNIFMDTEVYSLLKQNYVPRETK